MPSNLFECMSDMALWLLRKISATELLLIVQNIRAKEKHKSSAFGASSASLGVSPQWYFCCVLTYFAVPAFCYCFSLDKVCELSCLLFFDPQPDGD